MTDLLLNILSRLVVILAAASAGASFGSCCFLVSALRPPSTTTAAAAARRGHHDFVHRIGRRTAATTPPSRVRDEVVGRRRRRRGSCFGGRLFSYDHSRRSSDCYDVTDYSSSSSSYYLATCIPGLSSVLADELQEFGCDDIKIRGLSSVAFRANLKQALRTLLWTRTALKVMEYLCSSDDDYSIHDRDDLHQLIMDTVNVRDLLGDGKGGLLTLSITQVLLNQPSRIPQDLRHTHYTGLTVKNALCDSVRQLHPDGIRPDVNIDNPDVPLVVVLHGNTHNDGVNNDYGAQVSLYRQLHVGSLHRRGYRRDMAVHKAALKESLAAGLLRIAEWDEYCQQALVDKDEKTDESSVINFIDPMCGSGTFIIEAMMMAANMAPGLMRIKCDSSSPINRVPPVLRWKHDGEVEARHQADKDGPKEVSVAYSIWKDLLLDATTQAKDGIKALRKSNIRFIGNDIRGGALDLYERSLKLSGLSSLPIEIHQGDCCNWEPVSVSDDADNDNSRCFVVCNPPWGERLDENMEESWESLRSFLRDGKCPPGNTEAWILSGNSAATKHLGLRKSQSHAIKTGNQNMRWLQYIILDKKNNTASPSFSHNRHHQQDHHHNQYDGEGEPNNNNMKKIPIQATTRATEIPSPPPRLNYNKNSRDLNCQQREKQGTATSRTTSSRSRPKAKKKKANKKKKENEWLI